jgi:hypothetical protein
MASIKKLIATLSQRTAMYIGRNNILHLQVFIDGWCFRDIETIEDLHLLSEFQEWIATYFEITSTQNWAAIILFHSTDEQHALKQFFELFNEFLEETE